MDELSDEQIQQLMDLGIIPDKQDILLDQIKQAQSLRYGSKAPEMRGQAGGYSTAASPLEFLAYTLQGRQANKELEQLRAKQEELLKQQASGRKDYFRHLYPKRQPSTPLSPYDMEGGYE